MVRAYVITGGRARPARNAPAIDLLSLVISAGDRETASLGPEARSIVDLCIGGHLTLVEVASRVGLPVAVTKVLVGDLNDSGHVVVRQPPVKAVLPDVDLLEKVIHGLRAL